MYFWTIYVFCNYLLFLKIIYIFFKKIAICTTEKHFLIHFMLVITYVLFKEKKHKILINECYFSFTKLNSALQSMTDFGPENCFLDHGYQSAVAYALVKWSA